MVFDKTTEKQLIEELSLDKYKYISDYVNIKLISKVIYLIIACAEEEKKTQSSILPLASETPLLVKSISFLT